MIEGVLTTCRRCGADVSALSIRGVWNDDGVVHTPYVCPCGAAECFHMSPSDMRAVKDWLRQEAGQQPLGFLTEDEGTLLSFRQQLESADLGELVASWS